MKYFANSEVYLRTLKLNYKTDKELPMVTEENVFILSKYTLKYLETKGTVPPTYSQMIQGAKIERNAYETKCNQLVKNTGSFLYYF